MFLIINFFSHLLKYWYFVFVLSITKGQNMKLAKML